MHYMVGPCIGKPDAVGEVSADSQLARCLKTRHKTLYSGAIKEQSNQQIHG